MISNTEGSAGGSDERRYLEAVPFRPGQHNFFLVWEYESDFVPNMGLDSVDAETVGKTCFFEDNAVRYTEAMAQEIGHLLGRPDQFNQARKHYLMHGWPALRGVFLSKDDNAMNPTVPGATA